MSRKTLQYVAEFMTVTTIAKHMKFVCDQIRNSANSGNVSYEDFTAL